MAIRYSVGKQKNMLGTFMPRIRNFKNSDVTKNFRDSCTFENVSLRANQALLKSAEKNNQSSMELYVPDTPAPPDGGNEQEGE